MGGTLSVFSVFSPEKGSAIQFLEKECHGVMFQERGTKINLVIQIKPNFLSTEQLFMEDGVILTCSWLESSCVTLTTTSVHHHVTARLLLVKTNSSHHFTALEAQVTYDNIILQYKGPV